MNKLAIIYLHGFNSASLDKEGRLLVRKPKLAVLQAFCAENQIELHAPNVDYRDFENLVEDQLLLWNQLFDQGYQIAFMGSSMGGFASEYLAIKTGSPAIMINPVISPTTVLPQFIGVTANRETDTEYQWCLEHCQRYTGFEQELRGSNRVISRLVLLDLEDELLDSSFSRQHYQGLGEVLMFDGGSHSFDHMQEALPSIENLLKQL